MAFFFCSFQLFLLIDLFSFVTFFHRLAGITDSSVFLLALSCNSRTLSLSRYSFKFVFALQTFERDTEVNVRSLFNCSKPLERSGKGAVDIPDDPKWDYFFFFFWRGCGAVEWLSAENKGGQESIQPDSTREPAKCSGQNICTNLLQQRDRSLPSLRLLFDPFCVCVVYPSPASADDHSATTIYRYRYQKQ